MKYNLKLSRRKSICIKIKKDGNIFVLAPIGCDPKIINNFVMSKQSWINKHLQIINKSNQLYKDFLNLNKITIFGKEENIIELNKHYKIGDIMVPYKKLNNKVNDIKKTIVDLAIIYLGRRLKELADKYCFHYNDFKITYARAKWGSCSLSKTIRLNYRLVLISKELIDYVIMHELCHTQHMNHSKDFYAFLAEYGFNARQMNKRLKEVSFVLKLF